MQKELIEWYQNNKRNFPWRENEDPYCIWISEIMLQQTTTEAVIPYFKRFIKKYPDISSLSQASLEDVYKLWEGLGYYRRAKHILETAKYIQDEYNGVFPNEYEKILKLKGIGSYTAGAICSISFHMPTPAVDGNVLRIISRYALIKDNISLTLTQKKITSFVQELLDNIDSSSFNQGLMDLGATICRPKNPKCEICPIASSCKAYKTQQQNVLPINIKKRNQQHIQYITGIITYKDKFLIMQNNQGLLENLYGFIQYDVESPYSFIHKFENEFHQSLNTVAYIGHIKHVFTHKTWYMNIYHFELSEPMANLLSLSELDKLPISTAHKKVLKEFLKNKDII